MFILCVKLHLMSISLLFSIAVKLLVYDSGYFCLDDINFVFVQWHGSRFPSFGSKKQETG